LNASITPITAQPTSTNANLAKLARFVAAKLQTGAVRFELMQISDDHDGQREGRVDRWAGGADVRARELATEIEETARSDSSALGGVNAYALVAYGDAGEVLARVGFRVQADFQSGAIVPTERATLLGMRAQEMRHNEMYAQLSAKVSLEQIASYRDLVEDYRTELARARADLAEATMKRVEVVQLYESLASEKAKRELEAQREARHDRAQAEILSKVSLLWPIVMHKLSGAKDTAFAPGAQDILSHLLKNISREEVVNMARALPPEKAMLLWEVLANLLPPDPAAPAAAAGAPASPPAAGAPPPATPTEPPPTQATP
jgi:hypothetical protein